MKELQHFITQRTNADDYFETEYHRFEVDVHEIDLKLRVPNTYPLIYYIQLQKYPDLSWPDEWYFFSEENYVHPIYAIQVMMQRLREVYLALQDIGARIGSQSLCLDEVLGKPE